MVRSTFSSTTRSSPLPFGNYRQTLRRSINLAWLAASSMKGSLESTETDAALAERIEWPPQQPVEQRHHDAHDRDTENDAREVAGCGGGRDIGAEPLGDQVRVAPVRHLGHDRGVPRPARGGDGSGDVIGQDARQDDFDPP